jgi:uncharacterized protein YqjF (DUF2071 family)
VVHSPTSTVNLLTPSEAGKHRLLSKRSEPLFLARWDRAVFINYRAEVAVLQRQVPFELDLRDGQAFVSIVAFTLSGMRPRIGGRLSEWLFKPIATHEFLNVRTYVRHRGEPGIYFLAEWLSNPLSVRLGPRTFGLPYRFGRLAYEHCESGRGLRGTVEAPEGRLAYEGTTVGSRFKTSEEGSLTEFMLERYTAFTYQPKRARFFRVWHLPWAQAPAEFQIRDASLIATTGQWWRSARLVSGHYSPGADVGMGRPHRIAGFIRRTPITTPGNDGIP